MAYSSSTFSVPDTIWAYKSFIVFGRGRFDLFLHLYELFCLHTGIRNHPLATQCQMLPALKRLPFQYSIDQCAPTHIHKRTHVKVRAWSKCALRHSSCNSVHWISQSILRLIRIYAFIVIVVHLEFDNRFIGWIVLASLYLPMCKNWTEQWTAFPKHFCYLPIISNQHSWEAKIIWSINIFTSFIQFICLNGATLMLHKHVMQWYIGYIEMATLKIRGKPSKYPDSFTHKYTKTPGKTRDFCDGNRFWCSNKRQLNGKSVSNKSMVANKINTHKNRQRERERKYWNFLNGRNECAAAAAVAVCIHVQTLCCIELDEITYKCESILSFRYFHRKCTLHLTI